MKRWKMASTFLGPLLIQTLDGSSIREFKQNSTNNLRNASTTTALCLIREALAHFSQPR